MFLKVVICDNKGPGFNRKCLAKTVFLASQQKPLTHRNQFGNVELSNFFALAYLSVAVSTVSQILMVTLTNWTLYKATLFHTRGNVQIHIICDGHQTPCSHSFL